jgi:DNA-binding NtrC family response regulator
MSHILLVDDEPIIRSELVRLLVRAGHTVAAAGSVADAVAQRPPSAFDLVIADLRLPGAPGTSLIPQCDGTPVLIMTSFATVQSAVEAMKAGAADYISKPFDHEELLAMVDRLARRRSPRADAPARSDPAEVGGGMIGNCAAMHEVFARIRRVAVTNSTVLILGESGTGKELVARAVHEHSTRRGAPFVAVNCASIPEGLIESELFGHEKGAFTGAVSARSGLFQAADGGTLFLDEVGELPMAAQARLLRVLQDNEVRKVGSVVFRRVDVRLIAATHRDLAHLTAAGSFREDLYFRLRVLEIPLPPLRERREDLVPLANFLLAKACAKVGRSPLRLSQEALAALAAHPFPGNVRELQNALERAVILCEGGVVTADLLALGTAGASAADVAELEKSASLTDYFKSYVLQHQDDMSETELARNLGISRKALWERRIRLGVRRSR